jgi:hypothetical protein
MHQQQQQQRQQQAISSTLCYHTPVTRRHAPIIFQRVP